MKTLMALVIGALAAGSIQASPADSPTQGVVRPADAPTFETTTGVIVIAINDKPNAVLFISTSGRVFAVNYNTCSKLPVCRDLFDKMVQADKVRELALIDGTQI